MKKALILIAGTALSCAAFSQTYSSFTGVTTLTGLTVTPNITNSFTVSLASNASVVIAGHTYKIDQVFGVFGLNANGDIGGTAGTAPAGWSFVNNNGGPGGIIGYEGNSNNARINPGGSGNFTFTTLDTSKINGQGFHVLLGTGGDPLCGQTLYISRPNAVPEPSMLAGIGIGAIALLRRRRQR